MMKTVSHCHLCGETIVEENVEFPPDELLNHFQLFHPDSDVLDLTIEYPNDE